jgi:group I intron endonuclease
MGSKRINIYCYENKINGKVYIGQTANTLKIRRNNSYINSIHFNAAIKKYGIENFDSFIFAIVDNQEQADQEEIYWIAKMREVLGPDNVYNLANGGNIGVLKGYKMSEETKEKHRQNKLGWIPSEETRKKMSEAKKGKSSFEGKKHTEEAKLKISISRTGHKHSEETLKKMSSSMKGKNTGQRSEETKKKISEKLKGKPSDRKGIQMPKLRKFTPEIEELIKIDNRTNMELAKFYSCNVKTIRRIRTGKR